MKEIWMPIQEFPKYSISNYGRVRNENTNYILSGGYDKNGYKQVTLCFNGKQYNRRICRLVANVFLPNPFNYPMINHKDENKSNDYIDNLEWCSASYNINYGHRNDSVRQKVQCIETGIVYDGLRVAEKITHIYHSNISRACYTGCSCKGYHWKFVS